MDLNKLKLRLDDISEVNPALTCYHRDDPAPVLPLRNLIYCLGSKILVDLLQKKMEIHKRLVQ